MADTATGEETVDMVEVTWRGKSYLLTKEDDTAIRREVITNIKPYIDVLERGLAARQKIHQEWLDAAQMKDGLTGVLKAVGLAVSMKVGSVAFPDTALYGRATAALTKVRGLLMETKLKPLGEAIIELEQAIDAYERDILRFLKEVGASAQSTGTVLTVSTSVGFLVLGAMGAGVLVAGGASAATAGAVSSATVKVLQSGIEDFGKLALGEKVSAGEAIEKLLVDGIVAGATGAIGAKISPELLGPAAGTVAKQIGSKVAYFSTEQLQKLLTGFLANGGAALASSALSQAVEALGEIAKSGRAPTTAEAKAQFEKFLVSAVANVFLNNMTGVEAKAMEQAAKSLQSKLVPDVIKKVVAQAAPSSSEQQKVATEVYNALRGELGKTAVTAIANGARGGESVDQLATLGVQGIERDRSIASLIDKEVRAALKKRKIAVK